MNLRAEMPTVAAWIDQLRLAFGTHGINEQIRKGIAGEETFFAAEAGHTVGTPGHRLGRYITPARTPYWPADKPKPGARRSPTHADPVRSVASANDFFSND